MTTARIVGVLNAPISIDDLTVFLGRLTAENGPGLTIGPGAWTAYEVRTPGTICWCVTCRDSDAEAVASLLGDPMVCLGRRMVVCPDCGSKRCPRAAHHDQACAEQASAATVDRWAVVTRDGEVVAHGTLGLKVHTRSQDELAAAFTVPFDAARKDRAR